MIKLLKFIRKSWPSVLIILVLLVVQAFCELSLPSYTSDIVDEGIQQGGIDTKIPDVIRENEWKRLQLFLDENEISSFEQSYEIISEENVTKEEYKKAQEDYPVISTETLYRLKSNISQKDLDYLSKRIPSAELIVMMLTSEGKEYSEVQQKIATELGLAEGTDIMTTLASMPNEALNEMKKGFMTQVEAMPEVAQDQLAYTYVKGEYEAIGIDVGDIQIQYIVVAGAKMLSLAMLSMLVAIFVTMIASKVAAKAGMSLREQVFRRVVSFSNKEMDQFSTASLITRSTNDIQQIQMVLILILRIVFYAPIVGIGGMIKVLRTNTSMTWIIGLAVVVILFMVTILVIVAMPKFKKMQVMVDNLNLVAREILSGVPVIRAFSREKHEEKRFDGVNMDLMKVQLFTNRVMAFMMPTMMFVMNGIVVLIVWVGAKQIDAGDLQVGDMMAFIAYTMQIVIAFLMLTMMSIMLPRSTVSAVRIDEILNTEPEIKDAEQPKHLLEKVRGQLNFDHVFFRYPSAEENALEDIHFSANPGETTAIIGSTGSGKTTLVNLIPRLYDVTGGKITLDGMDIRELSQQELRREIGFVPQKGVLFSGTIESNLRFGAEDISEDKMQEAVEIAQAREFIEEKPEGYTSNIAQGGGNVSGGQKQRLSIARAIAKSPKLYIFDDSFSALDYKTDITLRKALKSKIMDSTVIIVAQRISTIIHAEKIIVIEEGRIAGIGTHEELLKDNEVYQQIATSQLSQEELTKGKGEQ